MQLVPLEPRSMVDGDKDGPAKSRPHHSHKAKGTLND